MRTPFNAQRLVLVPRATPGDGPVRRYRLARVRFDGDPQDRFSHLKRSYD